jgi:uncharacterized protein YheU (UPF0270 family)
VSDEAQHPVDVPYRALSAAALRGVLEAFVLREGTDYGEREYTLAEKSAHVMRQLERGEARIVFDPGTGSVDIEPVTARRLAATDGDGEFDLGN